MDVFKCDSCHLEFNEKATLLRHVSHKKICKSHYGELRLNDMRIEGKLTAKRKWWKDHADEAKKLYQSNKVEIRKRKQEKHVNAEQRGCTDEGKAFQEFYEFIYNESKHRALEELEDSRFAYDIVKEASTEKTIDLVFTHGCQSFQAFFRRNSGSKDVFAEDYPVADEIEKAMEDSYKFNLDGQIKLDMDNWTESVSYRITSKCRDQGEISAFNMFFKEFCETLYPKIQEKSLDFAFENFDYIETKTKEEEEAILAQWPLARELPQKTVDTSDIGLENMLEKKYFESIKEETIKAAIESNMGDKLSDKLDSKIAKQIRYMKAQDYKPTVYYYVDEKFKYK